MRSSIFSSRIVHVGVFLFALLVAAAPYEFIVRRAESQFGRDIRLGFPRSDEERMDWFLEAQRRKPASIFVVGNSQCQYGVIPDVLAKGLGVDPDRIFNLSFSGTSFIAGLQTIRRLDIHPDLVVACISPADFTDDMVNRGAAMIARLNAAHPDSPASGLLGVYNRNRQRAEEWLASRVHDVIRSSDPRYRRSPMDFWHLIGSPGVLGEPVRLAHFISTGQTGPFILETDRYRISSYDRGFVALEMTRPWDAESFKRLALDPVIRNYADNVFPNYRQMSNVYLSMALAQARDMPLVLLRMPTVRSFGEVEDANTEFGDDARRLAGQLGVGVITQDQFTPDLTNSIANYRDAVHLHHASAREFTEQLSARLCALAVVKRVAECR